MQPPPRVLIEGERLKRLKGPIKSAHARLTPKRVHAPSLDAANFLIADARGALGPYITIFLVANLHWHLADVGLVTSIGGWLALAAQTPIGAFLDRTERKRGVLIGALLISALSALVIVFLPGFWPVLIAIAAMQMAGGVFEPGLVALTVGLFSRDALTRRLGRNAAFARAGNFTVAGLTALIAWWLAPQAVFYQVPLVAFAAAIAVATIPHGALDKRRARGLRAKKEDEEGEGPLGFGTLLRSRPLLVLAPCVLLFQFAGAPLLTLVGQELAVANEARSLLLISICIMASQAGMLAGALVIGHRADEWGHKRIFIAAFAILVLQAVLTSFSDRMIWLLALQVFGGLGTGLLVALIPLYLADVMEGSGHYNLAQGFMATCMTLGVTTSSLVSEYAAVRLGYDGTFLGCAVIAAAAGLALTLFLDPNPAAEPTGAKPQPSGQAAE